jgi:hypothetical protein
MVQRQIQQAADSASKLRLQGLCKVGLAIFALFIVACATTYQWSASHPYYSKAPQTSDSIALIGIDEAFVLTRDKWFANHLNISRDSIYHIAGQIMESSVTKSLQVFYKNLSLFPDSLYLTFPEETQKLDERVFLRGRFPNQGIPVKKADGTTPTYLLLFHEFTVGLDLHRESFFDYALINQEVSDKKTSENLTIIVSYTLWDNIKQRPLFSSIIEQNQPIKGEITLDNLVNISQATAQALLVDIQRGVGK